ncbi:DoxX family protein [Pseudonocardia acaciae]|uniref:DoxX family protein n=1 Tax=Pseudonocardia acaciae TaxID=551276 RepID=UPI00048CB919|nr:DoxX family protein [Pseudonocardia acaciae]
MSVNPETTHTTDTAARPGKGAARTGMVLTVLAVLFLLFDSVTKLARLPFVVEATVQLGFPASSVVVIGATLLACLVLYVIPRTAVLGAVLLTGYLGGAVCTNLRVEAPLFSHVLFPIYVAVFVWLGLYLRNPGLRELVRTGGR